ncbi:MAG: L-histidine N(alpha)-methyltransferase [Alphaproteobacteria bacterium]|nr:L-histidine N(alpha)-methyltransferase [Alphaproteobacteria bacterium]
MKSGIEPIFHKTANPPSFLKDTQDFFARRRFGHMGNWRFSEEGLRLWDAISERAKLTGVYYIYSDELEMLAECGKEIASLLPNDITFIDLGPGSQQVIEEKLGVLFKALDGKVKHYIGVDIVPEILETAQEAFAELYPGILFSSALQDFYKDIPNLPTRNFSLAGIFGLTLFNIPIDPRIKGLPEEAISEMLKRLKAYLRPGEYLIVTQDCNRDEKLMKTLYEDQADLWRHVLYRIKNELPVSEGFDPEGFDYEVDWIEETDASVRKFVANKDMNFSIGEENFSITKGRRIFPP